MLKHISFEKAYIVFMYLPLVFYGYSLKPIHLGQRHTLRDKWPDPTACPACSLLDNVKKLFEIMCVEGNILTGPTRAKAGQKFLAPPRTNLGREMGKLTHSLPLCITTKTFYKFSVCSPGRKWDQPQRPKDIGMTMIGVLPSLAR